MILLESSSLLNLGLNTNITFVNGSISNINSYGSGSVLKTEIEDSFVRFQ